jgi:hypothetical protein
LLYNSDSYDRQKTCLLSFLNVFWMSLDVIFSGPKSWYFSGLYKMSCPTFDDFPFLQSLLAYLCGPLFGEVRTWETATRETAPERRQPERRHQRDGNQRDGTRETSTRETATRETQTRETATRERATRETTAGETATRKTATRERQPERRHLERRQIERGLPERRQQEKGQPERRQWGDGNQRDGIGTLEYLPSHARRDLSDGGVLSKNTPSGWNWQ